MSLSKYSALNSSYFIFSLDKLLNKKKSYIWIRGTISSCNLTPLNSKFSLKKSNCHLRPYAKTCNKEESYKNALNAVLTTSPAMDRVWLYPTPPAPLMHHSQSVNPYLFYVGKLECETIGIVAAKDILKQSGTFILVTTNNKSKSKKLYNIHNLKFITTSISCGKHMRTLLLSSTTQSL